MKQLVFFCYIDKYLFEIRKIIFIIYFYFFLLYTITIHIHFHFHKKKTWFWFEIECKFFSILNCHYLQNFFEISEIFMAFLKYQKMKQHFSTVTICKLFNDNIKNLPESRKFKLSNGGSLGPNKLFYSEKFESEIRLFQTKNRRYWTTPRANSTNILGIDRLPKKFYIFS